MCYMRTTEMKTQQVGVRELRQNLSRYLRLVAEGERFEVTEHNLPVAVLGPLPSRSSALERMISEGRIVPARLDLTELGPPPEQPHEMSISEALAAQREER
jgi:prevent-host-death family protein